MLECHTSLDCQICPASAFANKCHCALITCSELNVEGVQSLRVHAERA